MELAGRHIDRHGQVGKAVLPLDALRRRLLQHPTADRHDLATVLEQGDELFGLDGTEVGVVPPELGLHAGTGGRRAALQAVQGLEVEGELAPGVGHPQFVGQPAGAAVFRPDGDVVDRIAGRTALSCPVHGRVGPGDQCVRIQAVDHPGDADADRGMELPVTHRDGRAHRLVDPIRQRPGRRLRLLEVLHQDDELVPAESGHGVRGPHELEQSPGHLDEDGVARRVPESVVDRREIVQVDGQQHRVRPAAFADAGRPLQPVEEQDPVGQPGQVVVEDLACHVGLLRPEAVVERRPVVAEDAHGSGQAHVAGALDERAGRTRRLLVDAQSGGVLTERRNAKIAPGQVGVDRGRQVGFDHHHLQSRQGQDLVVVLGALLPRRQPPADRLGGEPHRMLDLGPQTGRDVGRHLGGQARGPLHQGGTQRHPVVLRGQVPVRVLPVREIGSRGRTHLPGVSAPPVVNLTGGRQPEAPTRSGLGNRATDGSATRARASVPRRHGPPVAGLPATPSRVVAATTEGGP